MEVNYKFKKKNLVPFSKLRIGDIFIYDSKLFMKTSGIRTVNNSVLGYFVFVEDANNRVGTEICSLINAVTMNNVGELSSSHVYFDGDIIVEKPNYEFTLYAE